MLSKVTIFAHDATSLRKEAQRKLAYELTKGNKTWYYRGCTDQAGFLRLLYQEASLRERPPGSKPPSLNQVSALYALRQSLFFSCFLHRQPPTHNANTNGVTSWHLHFHLRLHMHMHSDVTNMMQCDVPSPARSRNIQHDVP